MHQYYDVYYYGKFYKRCFYFGYVQELCRGLGFDYEVKRYGA